MRYFVCLCLLFILGACRTTSANQNSSDVTAMFKNSTRRDPTSEETQHLVKVGRGCSGYFVSNTLGKAIIGTARHCTTFSSDPSSGIEQWCKADAGQTKDGKSGAFMTGDGILGHCKEVALAENDFDIVFFEAYFDGVVAPARAVVLAGYIPKVFTKLFMVGYPADQSRQGKATATENCWIINAESPSPFLNTGPTNTPLKSLKDPSGRHNCSTYGGNSGGAIFVLGTREVVGLPFTYEIAQSEQHEASDENTAAYIALMGKFVAQHSQELKKLGIAVVEQQLSDPQPPTWRDTVSGTEKALEGLGVVVRDMVGANGVKAVTVASVLAGPAKHSPGEVITLIGARPIYSAESAIEALKEVAQGVSFEIVSQLPDGANGFYSRQMHWIKEGTVFRPLSDKFLADFSDYKEPFNPDEEVDLVDFGMKIKNPHQGPILAPGPRARRATNYCLPISVVSPSSLANAAGITAEFNLRTNANVRNIKASLSHFPVNATFRLFFSKYTGCERPPDLRQGLAPSEASNLNIEALRAASEIIVSFSKTGEHSYKIISAIPLGEVVNSGSGGA